MTDSDYLLLVKLLVRYGIKTVLLEIQRAVVNRPRDRYMMTRVNSFYRMLTLGPGNRKSKPLPTPKSKVETLPFGV